MLKDWWYFWVQMLNVAWTWRVEEVATLLNGRRRLILWCACPWFPFWMSLWFDGCQPVLNGDRHRVSNWQMQSLNLLICGINGIFFKHSVCLVLPPVSWFKRGSRKDRICHQYLACARTTDNSSSLQRCIRLAWPEIRRCPFKAECVYFPSNIETHTVHFYKVPCEKGESIEEKKILKETKIGCFMEKKK